VHTNKSLTFAENPTIDGLARAKIRLSVQICVVSVSVCAKSEILDEKEVGE
jgi:hypothetical protein